MASRVEVQDGDKNRIDAESAEALKAAAIDLVDNGSDYQLTITGTGTSATVNINALISALRTAPADTIVTTLISDLDAMVQALIGSDDVTANTLRKALADAVVSYDANIAST